LLAADAKDVDARGLSLQRSDQVRAVGVARCFTGDEQDAGLGMRGWELGMKDW
jgi:hypothetical protein